MLHKLFLALTYCLILFSLQAQTKGTTSWEYLFNGKNLTGWKSLNGHAKFEVVNKELVGTTVLNEPNSFLATDKEYGDFILEFEFKLNNQMNSGVQFRSEVKPDNGRVFGYQFEIDPSPRAWTAGIYDEARRDWLYPMDYHPKVKTAYQKGQWNKGRIECSGNSIRTFINGVAAANLVDDMTKKGFIALQVHQVNKPEEAGEKIYWRNIRIQTKNLHFTPPDTVFVVNLVPNTISPQEKSNGVKLLYGSKGTFIVTGSWQCGILQEYKNKRT